jgi:hypothetical protein
VCGRDKTRDGPETADLMTQRTYPDTIPCQQATVLVGGGLDCSNSAIGTHVAQNGIISVKPKYM